MSLLTDDEGAAVVRAARAMVEAEAAGRDIVPPEGLPASMDEKSGVFVTLEKEGRLRGCIGIVMPVYPARQALMYAARDVCHDPRFPALRENEPALCTVEVSGLTPPEKIEYSDPRDLPGMIVLGRDGLLLNYRRNAKSCRSAVFLPQVPGEQGWNAEEYLSNLCEKAGLQDDAWLSGVIEFSRFSAEVFSEEAPRGKVVRI